MISDVRFSMNEGDMEIVHELLMKSRNEYAKCKLSEMLETLRKATYHMDGLKACSRAEACIPFVGRYHVERYIERYAGDILEIVRKDEKEISYRLKDNHAVRFLVEYETDIGVIQLTLLIYGVSDYGSKYAKNLALYVKTAALREVLGLTLPGLIKKYNSIYRAGADRWIEPEGIFLYHGCIFYPVFDANGKIIDLHWYDQPRPHICCAKGEPGMDTAELLVRLHTIMEMPDQEVWDMPGYIREVATEVWRRIEGHMGGGDADGQDPETGHEIERL